MESSISESHLASWTARTKTMRSLKTLRSSSRSGAAQSSLSFACGKQQHPRTRVIAGAVRIRLYK